MSIEYKQLDHGFKYGSAEVIRLFSDDKKGWITLGINTPKESIQIYVTKTGKIRIHDKNGEWFRLS